MEVFTLANIKSAKKRILVNETKAARNKAIKSRVKTAMKKVEAAVAANDKAQLNDSINAIANAGNFKSIQLYEMTFKPVQLKKKTVLTV